MLHYLDYNDWITLALFAALLVMAIAAMVAIWRESRAKGELASAQRERLLNRQRALAAWRDGVRVGRFLEISEAVNGQKPWRN